MSTPGRIDQHILAAGRPVELPPLWDSLALPLAFFQPPEDSAAFLANLRQTFALDDLLAAGVVSVSRAESNSTEATGTVSNSTEATGTEATGTEATGTEATSIASIGVEVPGAARSGPAEVTGAEVVALAPALADPRSVLMAPRQSEQYLPRALLGPAGSVNPGIWSTAALLQDFRCQQFLREADVLVVVSNFQETAALWAAGIAAVPCQGLEQLAEPRLGVLATTLRIPRTITEDSVLTAELISWGKELQPARPPVHVVFANWTITQLTLERPPGIEEPCLHFRGLQMHLLPAARFSVWIPQTCEFEGLQFLLRYGGQPAVREALLASIAANSQPLCATSAGARAAPAVAHPDLFWQLASECVDLLSTLRDSTRRQRIWMWLQAGLERNLIAPLLERAGQSRDPVERSRLYTLAELGRLLYPQFLRLGARYTSSTAPGDAQAATCLLADVTLLEPLLKAQTALLRNLGANR